MADERVTAAGLSISKILFNFVNQEVIPGTNITSFGFWDSVRKILAEFSPDNSALLQKRDDLQAKIDQWHRTHKGQHNDIDAYKSFLFDIGYLIPRNSADNFQITTTNVDDEIAIRAGPQLVVPLMNARFTLNAANARWGSLYDALYGTDAISEDDGCEKTNTYNKKRGDKVIAFARKFLDQTVPLTNNASHANAKKYSVEAGELKVNCFILIDIKLKNYFH
jgi:malate synthase